MSTIYTSESVCAGHPDKICDQISDAVLDEALKQDPFSRVAVETMVGQDVCVMMGEVTTKAKLDYEKIARKEIKRLGYVDENYGFSEKSKFELYVHTQSREIAQGVDAEGAGDQGMMYGFACNDTTVLMPMPILMAHRLSQRVDEAREKKSIPYLRPDGKTQVSINYENDKPVSIDSIVIAVPHEEDVELGQVKEDLLEKIVLPIIADFHIAYKGMDFIVNGTGVWHRGGPASDTGLTGRKIIVDTYGGMGRIGGGAFSGKDPTKVDRSGAYAARYLAKNIVANCLADKCEVRLAYFIGAKKPVMLEADTFGTAKKSDQVIKDFMKQTLDTSVHGIIEGLNLRRPMYRKTAAYGHFGKDGLPWEKVMS